MPEEEEEEGGRPPRERDQQQQQQPPPPRRRPSFPAGEAAGVSGGKRARAPGGEGAAAKRRKRGGEGRNNGLSVRLRVPGRPTHLDRPPPAVRCSRGLTGATSVLLQAAVLELLRDPVLSDLPEIPTAEEVDTLIALESGSAYRVTVERGGLPPLRKASRRAVPYIWKTYCLALNGYPLVDDTAKLVDAGMRNNSVVTFLKAYPVRKKERPERPAKRKREARG
ncbi:MAG: hypothetical protein BJ554DRAFT_3534 [Olpidium bornovanus]|uniref:SNRNP25 ubiquitin-like domain-containing protein n=1 Tax=Olpidium bornovanus TaxID=278681 RepID=A0A8H8DM14_9FUNG|nr:MAG: hypothetical protein BJ554DRAFT_3534 [Olpidium bornovanus]